MAESTPSVEPSVDPSPDTLTLVRLRYNKGMTYHDIGQRYGLTTQAIHQRIQAAVQFMPRRDHLELYKNERETILNAAECTILNAALEPDKLKAASHNNLMYGFQQVFHARRLESGESTANVALAGLATQLDQLYSQLTPQDAGQTEPDNLLSSGQSEIAEDHQ